LRTELGLAGSGTPELTVIEGGAAGSDSAADDADGNEPTGGDADGNEPTGGDADGNEPTGGDADGNEPTGGDAAEPVAEEAKASPAEQAVAE
jgi:hypothetical protein